MPTKKKRYNRKAVSKDGKRSAWVSGYSIEEAEAKKLKKEAELNNIDYIGPVIVKNKDTSFRKWVDTWKKVYLNDILETGENDIDGMLRRVIYPEIATFSLDEIKPIHIQKILNNIQDKSLSYNHKVFGLLNRIFRDAENNDLIEKSPMRGIKQPSGRGEENGRSLTDEERKAILNLYEKDLEDGLFFMIMLYCGLRPQEVAALKWEDIDFREKYIYVKRALKKDGTISITKTKSGIRSIPIPEKLLKMLKEKQIVSNSDYVVVHSRGNHHTSSSINNLRKKLFYEVNVALGAETKKDGITLKTIKTSPNFRLYNLRHTYCTDLEKRGVPINIAKVLMGHSSISVTAKIYTHTDKETIETIRDKINN